MAVVSDPGDEHEDEEIVRIIRERDAADTGGRLSVEELAVVGLHDLACDCLNCECAAGSGTEDTRDA